MDDPIFYIFGSIVIALITSSFTVWLSLRKFRTEKMWERKIEVYSKIVEALYMLREYVRKQTDNFYGDHAMTKLEKVQWLAVYRQHEDGLKKFRDIGALIISKRAVDIINQYYGEISSEEDDITDRFDIDIKAVDKCIESILIEAKKDLVS